MNRQTVVLAMIIAGIVCSSAQGKYGGGSGEPNDPYLICDANHMQAIGADSNDWDKCFKLMADIDLGGYVGEQFNIIGIDYDNPFTSVFDGNGHAILNFRFTSTGRDYIGLFGHVSGPNAEIKDLRLIDPNVDAGTGWHFGSLAGYLREGTINNCYVYGGSISGEPDVGGLVGDNGGFITGSNSSAGVSGFNHVGGLVGVNNGIISHCNSSGAVSGGGPVGGLVGANADGTITNCWSSGSVSGDQGVGGLAGANHATITNCYSSVNVSGIVVVAGLVGFNQSIITKCYAVGTTYGSGLVGGLVAHNNGGVGADSFWDIETTGIDKMCGGQGPEGSGCNDDNGKITSEMQTQNTFTDAEWDFINVWNIGENQTYPYLRTYLAGDINKDGIVNFFDFALMALHWLEDYGAENPPAVWITYPEDGARLMVGGVPPQTMISAEANDYDGIVVRVEFFANDLKLGEDSDGSDGWNYLWQGYSLGWHVLTATAWDHEGLSGTSSPVNVEVWMPDPPPP